MSRSTLIEIINRNLSTDHGRSTASYVVSGIVGENDAVLALGKLCAMNQIHLLRMLMGIAIGIDPLSGRHEHASTCRFNVSGDVVELHFTSDDGNLCIALHIAGSYILPTACRYSETATGAKTPEISIG